jgi:hypothetical protein
MKNKKKEEEVEETKSAGERGGGEWKIAGNLIHYLP